MIILKQKKLGIKNKINSNKYKIIKYFSSNEEDAWFIGAVVFSFLFILIIFGLLYTLPLFTLVCVIKCILVVRYKSKSDSDRG